jgi:hypothetical protein
MVETFIHLIIVLLIVGVLVRMVGVDVGSLP